MITIVGDTHGSIDIDKLSTQKFSQQKNMTKADFVIVVGDFGVIWENTPDSAEKYWLKWLNEKNFTTLFLDGNHENFTRLAEYPAVDFHGGKAQQISDSVWHLMRGEIYTLENKKIFTFGGASSHDKIYRKEGISWWKEELPTHQEIQYAMENLDAHQNQVDLILTHCAPTHIQNLLSPLKGVNFDGKGDILTQYFESIFNTVPYHHWYFGHYHTDIDIDEKHHCLYKKRVTISDEVGSS